MTYSISKKKREKKFTYLRTIIDQASETITISNPLGNHYTNFKQSSKMPTHQNSGCNSGKE